MERSHLVSEPQVGEVDQSSGDRCSPGTSAGLRTVPVTPHFLSLEQSTWLVVLCQRHIRSRLVHRQLAYSKLRIQDLRKVPKAQAGVAQSGSSGQQ